LIYCVVPPELADDLYDRLVEYYKDDANVTVIIDRRSGPDRRRGSKGEAGQRKIRDRRRAHPGSFPSVDLPEG
jgi:hypothetical protein